MAVNGHTYQLGLIILCLFLTGLSGAEVNHVFFSSGESVLLPCNNALSDCTTTTWNYNRDSDTVELVAGGEKRTDRERHERLSVGSDCSLNIRKVTEEDYGLYNCIQYVNGRQHGIDATVFLHVLHVSSPSSHTEIRPGGSVTLYCQLYYYYGVTCDHLVQYEGVQLMWVNQFGVNLNTDSRYLISFSSHYCINTLTTTLLDEDHNREWSCQLTQRNQLKTSATYTVKYSVTTKTATPVSSLTTTMNTPLTAKKTASITKALQIPDDTKNSKNFCDGTTICSKELVIGIVVAALAVLLIAVVVCVILKRRVGNKRGFNDSVVPDKNTFTETYDTINISIYPTPSAKEQENEITYTEVATYCKPNGNKGHEDDKVTYSSVGEGKAEAPDNCTQIYATVNKKHQKT